MKTEDFEAMLREEKARERKLFERLPHADAANHAAVLEVKRLKDRIAILEAALSEIKEFAEPMVLEDVLMAHVFTLARDAINGTPTEADY